MSVLDVQIQATLGQFQIDAAAFTRVLNEAIVVDLVKRAVRVEAAAKTNATGRPGPNVITGRLRSSIGYRVGADSQGPYVDIGSNVSYACVFDAHTVITTRTGPRTIGQIEIGEEVLTQAGDFQPIVGKWSFPAVEKPELIDIEVPWRSDRTHQVTLTLDHRVLVLRDERNQWIFAGDLRDGDMLYSTRKLAHNKGTALLKTCDHCLDAHRNQGKRYCSTACRDEAWAAGANPHLGAIRSDATRQKISEAAKRSQQGARLNRQLSALGHETRPEYEVAAWLDERGVNYERQVPIGDYIVDFFDAERREIIEADGGYWHRDQKKDIERDRELLRLCPGVEITHIHFYDKARPPFEPIDPEPLAGVRYVVCNPGPKSYVDPERFRVVPATILRTWRYGDEAAKSKGTWHASLYDLAVNGVHSFLANGVVVSNSYVELGHGNTAHAYPKRGGGVGWVGNKRTAPRPFLLPALEAARTT